MPLAVALALAGASALAGIWKGSTTTAEIAEQRAGSAVLVAVLVTAAATWWLARR